MKKKLIALLLCVALIVSVTPVVSAQTDASIDNTYSTADETVSQTASEPYIISELTEKRTENTKHFLMSDRSVMAAVYDRAVHYEKDGSWVDIDNSLSTNDENDLENKDNSFKTKFSKKSNGNKLVTVTKDKFTLSWMLDNADKVNAVASQSDESESDDLSAIKNITGSVTYSDIQNNVDLQYVVSGEDIKENIILKNADAPTEYSFTYKFNKLKYRTNDKNQIEFYSEDDSENVVFVIDVPYMYDSDKAYSNDVEMQISETSNGFKLTLVPNKEWLQSEDRVYPIVIDPTTLSSQKATSVWDIEVRNTQTSAFWYKAGDFLVGSDSSGQVYRTLLKFCDLPNIGAGGIVVNAKMNITAYQGPAKDGDPALRTRPTDDIQVNVHQITANWPEQGVVWNDYANSYNSTVEDYFVYNDTSEAFTADITKLVIGWYEGTYSNYGVMLKANSEAAANHVMQFASSDWGVNDTNSATWRPILLVNYRTCIGLEDYWSYTAQSMGGYGTGYVNNYNGNLTYVHNDVSFNSLINGFTLSHVYNSASTTKEKTDANGKQILVEADTGRYGKGWGLNLVQKIQPITIENNADVKFVYTDGDGTKHYFVELDDDSIVDEDGLGYTLTKINETTDSGTTPIKYKITTKDKVVLKFDQWGALRRIIDANGNTINLNYSPVPNQFNYLTSITTSSGGSFALKYDTNYVLTSITDNANRVTSFSYADGNLTQITYPDGTNLKFEYSAAVSGVAGSTSRIRCVVLPNGNKYRYGYYNNGKIFMSADESASGTQINTLYYGYDNNQTTVKDLNKRQITYQFDSFGRVTCAYDSEGNSCSEVYTPNSQTREGIFANNKLSIASSNIKYINNLLPGGAFLNGLESWGTYTAAQGETEIAVVTDQAYISPKSIRIKAQSYGTHAVRQDISTSVGKTYTLSANIKTEDVQTNASQGAAVKINTSSSAGQKSYFSDFVTGSTDEEINNGFITVSKTLSLASDEKIISIAVGLHGAKGTVWIDSVQLEEGDTANKINLVENSSFEKGTTGYTASVSSPSNGSTNLDADSGAYSLKMIGLSSQNYNYKQDVAISGKAGDVYSFGAWTQGDSIPYGDELGSYKMVCEFTYSDGKTSRETIPFNTLVNEWQYGAKNIIAEKDYTKLTLFLCYNKNCNYALFDSVFLYRDTAQSYTYDKDGNVISTADYASQQANYEYGSSSLTRLLSPEGSSYEYFYDSNKNLVASRSNVGVQSDIKYDSYGNAISTQVSADNYSATIQSGKTYYIRLKGSGKYLAVEGSGTANNTNVCQESFTGANNQKWRVEKAVNGGYFFYPQHTTGKGLGITDNSNSQFANAAIFTHSTSTGQRFDIIPQSDYTYKIIPKCSADGKLLTVVDALTQNNVNIYSPQGELNMDQSWYFEDASIAPTSQIEDGAIYRFRARHSGRYINSSSTDIGTAVLQYEYNSSATQRFKVNRYQDTEYYTISLCNSDDRLLEISDGTNSIGYLYLRIGDSTISDSKLFKFDYNSSKQGFRIIPKIKEDTHALDVAYFNTKNNADLIFTGIATDNNRYFIAEKVSQSITSSATYQNNGNYPHTVTDSRGNTTTYTYDTSRGLQTGVTDALGNTTNYSYNSLNDRLNSVTSGDSTVGYTYKNVGLLNSIISPSGTVYNFTYDVFGNTTKILVGSQALTENTYDTKRGLLTESEYGNGLKIGYTYDLLDRVTEKLYNGVVKVKFRYDKFGNLFEKTDLFTNTTYRYSYDLIGRITGVSGSNGTSLNYVYDGFNRIEKYVAKFGDNSNVTEYIYGDSSISGQKDGLIYGVKQNGTQRIGYDYDELGRLDTRTLGTTTPFVTQYGYLQGVASGTTTTLVKTVKNGNDVYEYSYDAVGNITEIKKNGSVYESYTYDSLYQLKTVTRGSDVYEYTYDSGGNIQSVTKNGEAIKSYTYGDRQWFDLLTEYNGEAITYDEIGNPLTYRDGYNFTWSNGRQLTGITKGTDSISYLYNADGLRASKTVNGTTTDYYWLEGVLLGQKTGNDYIIYLYDENGSAYGIICNDTYYYYVFNAQGDVVGIIDQNGTQVVQYDYSAWGEVLSISGSLADTLGQTNPIRYRGYYYDCETGFYLTGTRYYDPEIGRFINADGEISDVGGNVLGYNLFAYCFNNPVNMDDPTGQWPKWLTGALNVVSGVAQMAAGAALGAFTSWTGVGAVAAGFLIVNGAATATQGIGQIVNDVTKTNVLREDNIVRTAVKDVGRAIGGDTGAKIAGGAYDVAAVAANLYAGKVGLQQTGLAPIKVNINKVLNNPMDEFVTCGPAPGVISDYCHSIPLNGYGKIYATQLPNGFYQLANGHHRVAALRSLGKETIKIFLTK